MMKRSSKWVALVSGSATAMSLLASVNNPAQAAANPNAQHETISIAFPGNGSTPYITEKDPMVQYLEKKFNVTLTSVNESWSNYDQQTQLWATAGKLPDVFFSDMVANGTNTTNQWINEGLVQALPSDLSRYPYLKSMINLPDVKAFQQKGQMWFVPLKLQTSTSLPGDRGIVVRKDWMEKLHLNQPKTWNDLVNILKAFVNNNPDHNKNVVGFTAGDGAGIIDNIAFNEMPTYNGETPQSAFWIKFNGKWQPSYTTPHMLKVLNELHQLYAAGLLDKDFANSNNPASTKFINGQAGMYDQKPSNIMQLEQSWNTAHPKEPFNQYVELLQLPAGYEGKQWMFQGFNWWAEEFINSNVDSTKMARILAMLNWLESPQGRIFSNFGIKGTDYKLVNGKIQSLHPQDWQIGNTYPSSGLWTYWAAWHEIKDELHPEFNTVNPIPSGWDTTTYNKYMTFITDRTKEAKPYPINWTVNAYAESLPPLKITQPDWVSQAIASNNPAKIWSQAVAQQMSAGLADDIKAVNAQFK